MNETCNSTFGGGEWIFGLIVLALLANGGFGGFGSNPLAGQISNLATNADVQRAADFQSIERQNSEGVTATRQSAYDVMSVIKDANYNTLSELRDLQEETTRSFSNLCTQVSGGFGDMRACCCDLARSIDGVNYNGAINTANINANTTAQTQKILDAIAQSKIETLQGRINSLELQAATYGVLRYPNAWTYNAGMSPFCGNPCGCGC